MALFSEISVSPSVNFLFLHHLSVWLFTLLTATSLVLVNIFSNVDEGSGLTGLSASPLPLKWQPESHHASLSVASNWIQNVALTYWVPRALALVTLAKLPSSPGSATRIHLIPWICPNLPLRIFPIAVLSAGTHLCTRLSLAAFFPSFRFPLKCHVFRGPEAVSLRTLPTPYSGSAIHSLSLHVNFPHSMYYYRYWFCAFNVLTDC